MLKPSQNYPAEGKRRIISFDVTVMPYNQVIKRIIRLAITKAPAYVCVANAHMCIEAWRDKDFALTVDEAEIVTPDGMPLVTALRYLYGIKQDRIAGMDLLPSILGAAEQNNCSIYLYGSTNEVLDKIQARIRSDYPALTVAGSDSPPFRPLTKAEEREDVQRIIDSGAHIVLVALGCPKQERWMARHTESINAVLIGLGGAFPVFAGFQKRAPEWMCSYSLEWLYRLGQEPRRLFKRYFVSNSLFLLLLLREYAAIKTNYLRKGSL